MRPGTWHKTATIALLTSGLALSSCTDEVAPSILILGNSIPDATCTIAAGGTGTFLGSGVLDLSLGNSYYVYLGVQNNFPALTALAGFEVEDGRVDPATVTVTGVKVTLDLNQALLQQAEVLQRFVDLRIAPQIPLSYTVSAGSTLIPGSGGAVIAEVIPPHIGDLLRAIPQFVAQDARINITVQMRVVGNRQDGRKVESGTFGFPLQLCNNCLVSHIYPESVARNPFNQANPDLVVDPGDIEPGCNFGQDQIAVNAACGAFFFGDACALDRCLGQATATLTCDTDGAFFPVP